jgi:membrane protein
MSDGGPPAKRRRPALPQWALAAARWAKISLPARSLRRFASINGRDRALAIGGQAFTAVIPLFIVLAAAAGQGGTSFIADRLTQRFQLSGSAAEALQSLFRRPPGATGAITIVGLALLLLSLMNLSKTLQRTFEAAWGLPRSGMRGTLDGLTGVGMLVASLFVLSLVARFLWPLPAGEVLDVIFRGLVAAVVWLVVSRALLSWRVPIRRVIPGAIVAGIVQTALSIWSTLWMPRLLETNADRYGAIGVTFALLSWLVVVGFAMVAYAVVSAELGGAGQSDDEWEPAPLVSALITRFTRRR